MVSAASVVAIAVVLRFALCASRRDVVTRRLPARPGAAAVHHDGGRPRWRVMGEGPGWLGSALASADVETDPSTVWALWCVGVPVLALLTLVLVGPVPAVTAGVVSALAPAVALRAFCGRADARVDAGLPSALEAVARGLRTGASLRQAVAEAAGRTPGALGHELQRVATQAQRGAPLVGALENMAQRRPLPGVRLAVAALCLGAETGGAQAQAVDGVATTLRDRLAVIAEVRALSSQARLSAVVISVAPLGFGAFAAATDPRTAEFLFHTLGGTVLLVAGGLLDGLGWIWMNRLARVTP